MQTSGTFEAARNIFYRAAQELPSARLARAASIFFSLSVLSYLLSIAGSQIFFALAGVLYFTHLLRANPKPRIAFPSVKLPLALFCIWTVISVCFATYPAVGGYSIRKLTLFLILLFAANLIVSRRHLVLLLKVMFVEAAVAGIAGAAQFVRQYRLDRVEHPHQIYLYMTLTRITGFQGHWMNFGGQQMLMFCVLLALLLPARASMTATAVRRSRWWWVILAIVLASILLNLTRGVWLGCFAGAIYLVARWRAKWLWALPVIVIVSILAGPRMMKKREESVLHPSRDHSLAERFEMWHVGWNMMKAHPLVGVGPDNIPDLYDQYMPGGKLPMIGYHGHLHDNFIQFAAERGFPCLVFWVWLMVAFLWECIRIRRKAAADRWICDGAIAMWIAFMAEGIFEFSFGSSLMLMLFLFLIVAPFVLKENLETVPRTHEKGLAIR